MHSWFRAGAGSAVLALVIPGLWIAGCGDDDGSSSSTGPEEDLCDIEETEEDKAEAPPIYTPRWAFEPWISKDISDGPDTYEFVDGFIERDIPVGVVVLDSPWETNYNTFIPNPDRYPDFGGMVSDLRDRDVRVVLWVTQMINESSFDLEPNGDIYNGSSPNYSEGKNCGFYVMEGRTYGWWKGLGAGLDFHNAAARSWWHRQQDALYEMGVAGWKLDFGESYIDEDTIITAEGDISHQEYSERYYEDFYAYGSAMVGTDEFVTMVRPYDKSYQFEGRFFARPEHAPVAWVGDNRRDWIGLKDALDHIFRSAEAGYAVVGSDIGGYLNNDDADLLSPEIPFSAEVFARWTAVGAMTPFMQLHGRSNVTPWTIPDEGEALVPLYRYWSKLHREMIPFLYSLTETAYAGGSMPIDPVGSEADWEDDYRYFLGEAFLVAPILDDTGDRDVDLPAGSYYDWWDPTADALAGNQTLSVSLPDRAQIPLYVKRGAIIPMNVVDDVTGIGSDAAAGALTVLVYPDTNATEFMLTDEDEDDTVIGASQSGATSTITLSRTLRDTLLRVRADNGASTISIDGSPVDFVGSFDEAATSPMTAWDDTPNRFVWIHVPAGSSPVEVVVTEALAQ